MRRWGLGLCLGSATALLVGALVFAAREEVLRLVDRVLANVTLLRVIVALGVLALVHITLSLCRIPQRRLPTLAVSSRGASIALGGLVGLAGAMWSALNSRVAVPSVLADELIYMSLARSMTRGEGPVVRGMETLGYGLAYPALLTPIYRVAADGAQAFTAVQIANAFVMATAAVPAFLLSRMVLDRGDALLVAGLSVATPLLDYSSFVLTEPLFYPAFLWCAYAVACALTRPTIALQLLAMVALVGLCNVRLQAVVLVPATAIAAVLMCGPTRDLSRYRVLLAGLCATALVAAAVRLVSGVSPLGAYDVLVTRPEPLDLLTWLAREIGGLALALGVIAVVVFPVATIRLARCAPTTSGRAVGAVSLTFATSLLLSVAALDASVYGLDRTHLRNIVAVSPLALVAGVAWIRGGMVRPAITSAIGATLVVVGALAIRPTDLEGISPADAPAFLPWGLLASTAIPHDRLLALCVGVAVIVALTTRVQWVLPVSVAAAFLIIAPYVVPRTEPWGLERDRVATLSVLDQELGPDGDGVVITAGIPDAECRLLELDLAALWTELFNMSAARAHHLFRDNLAASRKSSSLEIAPDGTLLDAGAPLKAQAVAIDARLQIDGAAISTIHVSDLGGELAHRPGGLTFWRTNGVVRLTDTERVAKLADPGRCRVVERKD